MSDPTSDSDPLSPLAESFLARLRRGEHPALCEYTERHPELAERIRNLFPALAALEQVGPVAPEATGAYVPTTGPSPRPERLGEFTILREIGRGGMGVVYEALQESLGRHVALKVLPASARIDPNHLERFRREAKAAAGLHHSNIVPVFGVGQSQGVHYYAMQFIWGQTLDAVLDEVRRLRAAGESGPGPDGDLSVSLAAGLLTGQFAPAEAETPSGKDIPTSTTTLTSGSLSHQTEVPYYRGVARIGVQVAEALAYAHDHGVLHRDIKPSNLLLDAQGTVWVTDFGLARTGDQAGLTHTGDIVGTLRYMAPERFQGCSDPQSDVYSLGATLYEMLTLRPAFEAGDRLELIEQVTRQRPPAPRGLDRRIPRDLETIVQKAMAREPVDRYASAGALAEDLRLYLADRPILARRAGTVERAWRWSRRNPLAATLMGGIAALLVLLAVGGTWAGWSFAQKAEVERGLRKAAIEARGTAIAKAKEAQDQANELVYSLYIDRVNRAYREWEANNIALAEQLLDACPKALRGWEWRFVRRLCHLDERTDRNAKLVQALAIGPDGTVASAGGDWPRPIIVKGQAPDPVGELVFRDSETGQERFAKPDLPTIILGLAFSPDGDRLASGAIWKGAQSHGELTLRDARTGQVTDTKPDDLAVLCVAFSRDGRYVAAGYGENRDSPKGSGYVKVWEVSGVGRLAEKARLVDPGQSGPVYSVSFGLDGRIIAASVGQVRIWQEGSAGWSPGPVLLGHTGIVFAVASRPDGKQLASAGWDRTVRLWDPVTGRQEQVLRGHNGFVRCLAYSRDGCRLASGSEDRSILVWDTVSGSPEATLRGHRAFVMALAFHPDGRCLVSGGTDRLVKTWDLARGQPLAFREHRGYVYSLDIDSKGTRAVSGGGYSGLDRSVRVWDLTTGRQLWAYKEHDIELLLARFRPDGRYVVTLDYGGTVRVWDATDGHDIAPPLVIRPSPDQEYELSNNVAIRPDGREIAIGHRDGTIRLWDLKTRTARTLSGRHTCKVIGLAYSPDGRRLASTSAHGGLTWYDAQPGGELMLWDVETGRELATPRRSIGVFRWLAFSLDGLRLVLSDGGAHEESSEAYVWDAETGAEVFTLRGHTANVQEVAFSPPDSRRIATASYDGTVKLWDAETGRLVFTIRGHTAGVQCLDFSLDGNLLVSAGIDWTARVWDATPIEPEAPAKPR